MTYTFEKAIKEIESFDSKERFTKYEVRAMLDLLQEEYAPTIELTKEQYDALSNLDIEIIKQVLLYPETVKVVNE